MNRQDLMRNGYTSMCARSDLKPYGYQIRYWFNPSTKDVAIEYRWCPDPPGPHRRTKKTARNVGNVVIQTYEEQAAFHRLIGAQVTPPGEVYDELGEGVTQEWLY